MLKIEFLYLYIYMIGKDNKRKSFLETMESQMEQLKDVSSELYDYKEKYNNLFEKYEIKDGYDGLIAILDDYIKVKKQRTQCMMEIDGKKYEIDKLKNENKKCKEEIRDLEEVMKKKDKYVIKLKDEKKENNKLIENYKEKLKDYDKNKITELQVNLETALVGNEYYFHEMNKFKKEVDELKKIIENNKVNPLETIKLNTFTNINENNNFINNNTFNKKTYYNTFFNKLLYNDLKPNLSFIDLLNNKSDNKKHNIIINKDNNNKNTFHIKKYKDYFNDIYLNEEKYDNKWIYYSYNNQINYNRSNNNKKKNKKHKEKNKINQEDIVVKTVDNIIKGNNFKNKDKNVFDLIYYNNRHMIRRYIEYYDLYLENKINKDEYKEILKNHEITDSNISRHTRICTIYKKIEDSYLINTDLIYKYWSFQHIPLKKIDEFIELLEKRISKEIKIGNILINKLKNIYDQDCYSV